MAVCGGGRVGVCGGGRVGGVSWVGRCGCKWSREEEEEKGGEDVEEGMVWVGGRWQSWRQCLCTIVAGWGEKSSRCEWRAKSGG